MAMNETYKADYPGDSDFGVVDDVMNVNHRPHPFTIGARHVAYASDHCGGILDERAMRTIPCAANKCKLSYDQHTSDRAALVKLTRNVSNKEAAAWLSGLKEWCAKHKIDGFAFIDTGFRILPPVDSGGDE
jgi:hypothetical protein